MKDLLSTKNLRLDYLLEGYDVLMETISEKLKRHLSNKNILELEKTIEQITDISLKKDLKIHLCKSYILHGKISLCLFSSYNQGLIVSHRGFDLNFSKPMMLKQGDHSLNPRQFLISPFSVLGR